MEAQKRSRQSIQVSHVLLPNDVTVEILSWLPVKSVLRFKSVCKSWKFIIQQRFFIEKHHKSQVAFEYVGARVSDKYRATGYCNGLLLEERIKLPLEYRIKNPATNQVLYVVYDNSDNSEWCSYDSRGILLGFDSSTSRYSLISIHKNKGRPDVSISVLTFGYDDDDAWSWNRYLDSNLMGSNFLGVPGSKIGNRVLRWTCSNDLFYLISLCFTDLSKSDIVRSTLDGKNSMNIKFPQTQSFLSSEVNRFQVFIDRDHGKLSIGFITEQELHMWVLDNYSEHIWSEKKIIPLDFMKDYPVWVPSTMNVLYYWSSKNQMHINFHNHLLQYDIHSKKYIRLAEAHPGQKVLYKLVPSLVSLKGMLSEDLLNLSL